MLYTSRCWQEHTEQMSALTLVKPISVIIWPQKVFTCLDLVFKVNMPHLSLKNCMTRNSISTKGRESQTKSGDTT